LGAPRAAALFAMVDRLAAQLLALGAGASTQQLSALTTTNLDALRAYLDGVVAYRSGVFEKATPLLERAVQLDSTFALATSALVEANDWQPATVDMDRVRRLAWQYRERLAPRDQLLLSLRLGSHYPRETLWQVRIADREAATRTMPDSPEAWYYLGDALFHYGYLADISDPLPRARQAFEQAFHLDSLYGGPITHLQSLALVRHDTTAARLWLRRMTALGGDIRFRLQAEWGTAAMTRNARRVDSLLAAIDSVPAALIAPLPFILPFDSVLRAHSHDILESVRRRAVGEDRMGMMQIQLISLSNRGRPREANAWFDSLRSARAPRYVLESIAIMSAVFEGDTVALDALSGSPQAGWAGVRVRLTRILLRGDSAAADTVLRTLRTRTDSLTADQQRSRHVLDAWAAVQAGRPTAAQVVTEADSALRGVEVGAEPLNFIVAQLLEQLGRNEDALRVVRRRFIALGFSFPIGLAAHFGSMGGWRRGRETAPAPSTRIASTSSCATIPSRRCSRSATAWWRSWRR